MSSNCRVFMFTNALVRVSGCVPDIICVAQVTLKFVDHALIVDNRRLLLFRGEDLTDLFLLTGQPYLYSIFSHRFCISLFTELADCWFLNGSGTTILRVLSLASSSAVILSILRRNLLIEELIKFHGLSKSDLKDKQICLCDTACKYFSHLTVFYLSL